MPWPSPGRELGSHSPGWISLAVPWKATSARISTATGEGLDAAISNTLALAVTDSVYDIEMNDVDNPATGVDEREFIVQIRHQDCAEGDPLECAFGSANECRRCDVGAFLEYEVVFTNTTVSSRMAPGSWSAGSVPIARGPYVRPGPIPKPDISRRRRGRLGPSPEAPGTSPTCDVSTVSRGR